MHVEVWRGRWQVDGLGMPLAEGCHDGRRARRVCTKALQWDGVRIHRKDDLGAGLERAGGHATHAGEEVDDAHFVCVHFACACVADSPGAHVCA